MPKYYPGYKRIMDNPPCIDLQPLLEAINPKIKQGNFPDAKRTIRERLDEKRAGLVKKRGRETAFKIAHLKQILEQIQTIESAYNKGKKKSTVHAGNIQFFLHKLKTSGKINPADQGKIYGRNAFNNAKATRVQFIIECDKPMKGEQVLKTVSTILQTGSGELKKAGMTLNPLFKNFKKELCYELAFAIPCHDIKGYEYKISTALRELGGFKRVAPIEHYTLKDIQDKNQKHDRSVPDCRPVNDCCCSDEGKPASKIKMCDGRPVYPDIPDDTEWHIRQTRIFEAWELVPVSGGQKKGKGIVVGHPDTGWRKHPQFDPSVENIFVDKVKDVITNATGTNVPQQPCNPQFINYLPTHGVGTGAMIVSKPAAAGKTHVDDFPFNNPIPVGRPNTRSVVEITGVAPEAGIIPIHCVDGPALIFDTNVQKAVEYAIDQKVDVISISLGGAPDRTLEDIINHAVANNIIVVAAAGQIFDFLSPGNSVIEPGAYTNVIAVAGSNPAAKPWDDSCRGPNVDIAAPAQHIWFANWDVLNPVCEPGITYGSGTSFATPIVAGIAALWLAYWGKANLIQNHYPNKPLAHVFRHIIRKTAWKPSCHAWDTTLWGPGIIDAFAVLSEPLPKESDVTDPAVEKSSLFSVVTSELELLEKLPGDIWDAILSGGKELVGLIQSNATVQYWENQAARALAAAEGLTGDALAALTAFSEQAAKNAEDALDKAEDAIQQAADDVEATVSAVENAARETANQAEDAAEDLLGFFTSLI